MEPAEKDNLEFLDAGTPFFRLDEKMRVMPVRQDDLVSYIEDVMGFRWTYQTKLSDGTLVSSTFLGVGMQSGISEQRCLFETMVFDPEGEPKGCLRYTELDHCISGHHQILKELDEQRTGNS